MEDSDLEVGGSLEEGSPEGEVGGEEEAGLAREGGQEEQGCFGEGQLQRSGQEGQAERQFGQEGVLVEVVFVEGVVQH